MKAEIHINGKVIFSSKKISQINLTKKTNELAWEHHCMKMEDRVRRGFRVFTSPQSNNK